jgi:hypothetical protein
MDPIKADCHTTYKAVRESGVRPLGDIIWIVMHDTEGGTAKSNAQYFASKKKGPDGEYVVRGSSHLVVDDIECYRCLKNDQIPWGAPSANEQGFHIEQCGYARWTADQWRKHMPMLERGAYKAAYHCHLFAIRPVFLTAKGLHTGISGITTHAEVSLAFPNRDGNHTDPGEGWPRAQWMQLVKGYYAELGGGV